MRTLYWRRIIDTGRETPHDLSDLGQAEGVIGSAHRVEARSLVVLFAPLRRGA